MISSLSMLVAVVSLAALAAFPAQAAVQTGTFCAIFYGLPGNIDYPWSSATLINLQYDDTPVLGGRAVAVLGGTGSRRYTTKFGTSFSVDLTVAPNGTDFSDNYLYLDKSVVDKKGLTWILASATQFPGHGPADLRTQVNLFTDSGNVIVEQDAFRIDASGSGFVSNIPGFQNVTLSAVNVNQPFVDYDSCSAPITIANGRVVRVNPAVGVNVAASYNYNYFITDGATYQVVANLTLQCNGSARVFTDQLGNDYQIVTNITGTRVYSFGVPPFSTPTTVSTVTGLSTAQFADADQRIYPFAALQVPGVYTPNTAPYVDFDGIEYSVSPSVFRDGVASGTLLSAVSAYVYSSDTSVALEEGSSRTFPLRTLQQQQLVLA